MLLAGVKSLSKVIMLDRRALAFMVWAQHGSNTDGVVTYELRHRGEARRVRTRATTGVTRGAVGEHLAYAQSHQRGWVKR